MAGIYQDQQDDSVAILDAGGRVVLETGDVMSVTVIEGRRLTEHPVEDGSVITDHYVKEPTEVTVSVVVSDDIVQQLDSLRDLYESGDEVSVLTRTGLYEHLIIIAYPHREMADTVGASIDIVMRSYVTVSSQYDSSPIRTAQPKQEDTAKRGKVTVPKLRSDRTSSVTDVSRAERAEINASNNVRS